LIDIVDNFLDEAMYNRLREHADTLNFTGVQNPVDGVVYPGISTDIPDDVRKFILRTLKPRDFTLFMRLSLAGVPVPHQAHTDTLMGTTSLMLYLNRPEHCRGGTSFVKHKKTGMISDPRDKFEERVWQLDTNKRNAWAIYEQVDMKPNRAAIFPAKLMHRAEPSGGFGTEAKNGRLVLTMFYS
jgi:hypothetical protein